MKCGNGPVGVAAFVSRGTKRGGGLLACAVVFAVVFEMIALGALPALGAAPSPTELPTGGKIISGQGSIAVKGAQMTVTQQANKMIANWDTFNIGRNAGVSFVQPSASSSALNRILDQDPSRIFGSLTSNGKVFLLNPSGIIFGPTAQVNVGSLVASSLNLSNADFLAGTFRFENAGSAGAVINQGSITTGDYGVVALIAPRVTNSGTISAPKGSVGLAAGNRVALDFAGDGLIKVSVSEAALEAAVENSGAIRAEGGKVVMTAAAAEDLTATVVNNTGIIEANSIAKRNGVIVLDGGEKGIVANSGAISAKGEDGAETGGTVTLTGDKVGLYAGSSIDASGPAGGGTVNIGGGWQGSDSAIRNASAVYMDAEAKIAADAGVKGDGGAVVLWSEKYTNFQGSISAKGGPEGGNGGRVETSSAEVLDAMGSVNTLALKGNDGEWLLDPSSVIIINSGTGTLSGGVFDPVASIGTIAPSTILAGLLGGNVTIRTHAGSAGTGDITVADSIETTTDLGGTRTLTLQADRDITFSTGVGIDATTGDNTSPLNVVLWSNYGDAGGAILMRSGSWISSNGGNITLGGGLDINTGYALGRDSVGSLSNGISLIDAQLFSGGGDITLRGRGANLAGTWDIGNDGALGVLLAVSPYSTRDTIIDSGSGRVSITGVGALSDVGLNGGVVLATGQWVGASGTVTITSANSTPSAISIYGDASPSTSSDDSAGLVFLGGSTVQATNGGGIQLTGIGGSGGYYDNCGIFLVESNILANSGPISITGIEGSGVNPQAILLSNPQLGQAAGTGVTSSSSNITLTGDSMLVGGIVQTSGIVTIQPRTPSTTIGLGSGSVGTLNIDWDNWDTNGSFVGGAVIGRADGTGAINIGSTAQGTINFPHNTTILNTGAGSGGITLNRNVMATGNITLATTGPFINNVGANALTVTGGNWLIYSADPGLNTQNGLVPDFYQYNAPYSTVPLGAGNGFLYTFPAFIIVSLTGNVSKVYDATTAATLTSANYVFSGGIAGDTVNLTLPTSGAYDNKNAGTNKEVSVTGVGITSVFHDSIPVYGYQLVPASITGNIGTITPAPLTIAAVSDTKTYDGTTASSAVPVVSGLVDGDTVTNKKESFDSASVGGRTLLVSGYTINDDNGGNNYSVATTTAPGTINPSSVSENQFVDIQSSLTSIQAVQNTSNLQTDPFNASISQASTAAGVNTSALTAASNLQDQGVASQKNGDFKDAALSFKEAADLLLKNASLPEARKVIEMMKTAELQDYFNDAGIALDNTHKTRLEDIPADTAVIYALIFPERLEIILSFRDAIKRFTVPVDAQTLTRDVNSLRTGLQRRTRWDYLEVSNKLYRLMIKPLELELSARGINTLIFMPDGALRTVPFAALHDGGRFLIEKYAVVVTPSLDLTDPRMIRRRDTKVLSAGLTEGVQGFAPLVNVKHELDGIQDLYKADRLENRDFVGTNVSGSLRDNRYSIVHIATHGQFAPDSSNTFLLLWDGKIDMNQLDSLMKQPQSRKERVELLSLSACETAVGDDRAALGLAGVAVKAGARSALATLWNVSDQASSELVLEFYHELRNANVSKAAALQAAQLKLMDDPRYKHPYYWSPFLLIGNWL